MKALLSREFLEQYKQGKRFFSSIIINFADFHDQMINDIVIKDSKLSFVTFFNCKIRGAKFVNCEIFYGSWNGGYIEDTIFDRCKIDYTIFHNGTLKNVKIASSNISWSLFFSRPTSELDYYSSFRFRVFNDPSQVTDRDLEEALRQIMPLIDNLDLSIRMKIKEELGAGTKKYGREIKNMVSGNAYEKTSSGYNPRSGYGIQNPFNEMLSSYMAQTNAYKTKKPYETKGKYK